MDLSACCISTIRWMALLRRAINNPLMCWFAHVERRWDHGFVSLFVHSIQLGLMCVSGHNMYSLVVYHVLCVAELQVWLEGIPSVSWFGDATASNTLNLSQKYFLAHVLIMIKIFLVMKACTLLREISSIFTNAGT